MRNPKAMWSIIINSLIIALVIMSVFFQTGQIGNLDLQQYYPFDDKDKKAMFAAFQQYVTNITGLGFMISN